MNHHAVLALLENGEWPAVKELLLDLACGTSPDMFAALRERHEGGYTDRKLDERLVLASIAAARTLEQGRILSQWGFAVADERIPLVVDLLQQGSPRWLPAMVDRDPDRGDRLEWRILRALVRAGMVPAPTYPRYFWGTVGGIQAQRFNRRGPLLERLLDDPELIGAHLITMLATDGIGAALSNDNNAAAEFRWSSALLELSNMGRLDRNELLDVVLAAPLRDWRASELGWFGQMHDVLSPSLDEVDARQATYVRILAVEHGPSVKIAQRELGRLLVPDRLELAPVVDASHVTLARTDKATVMAQLRLLFDIARTHPEVLIADAVRVATDHPRRDVRDRAHDVLGRVGASLDVPAPNRFVPPAADTPAAADVYPVHSADELAELLLDLLEDVDSIQMERAIDGLLRFADERPTASEAIQQRVLDIYCQGPWSREDPRRSIVATLARLWLEADDGYKWRRRPIELGRAGRSLESPMAPPETISGAVARRFTSLARLVRERNGLSIALPTSTNGAIDVNALNRRLAASNDRRTRSTITELAVAVLRVHPVDRQGIDLSALSPEVIEQAEKLISRPAPVWDRQLVSLPVFRDRMANTGEVWDGMVSRPDPEATVGHEMAQCEHVDTTIQTLALAATLLPHDPDVLAAHAHPFLLSDSGSDKAVSVPLIDALAQSQRPTGDPEASALALALTAKDTRARISAQDAVVDLARHGLLDGARLGHQLRLHLEGGVGLVAGRISDAFVKIVRADDRCLLPILAALEASLPALPGRRDAAPFIELATDLVERTGRRIDIPDAFTHLGASRSSSATAQAARRLARASQ
jgi:hypothetical protein